MKKYTTLKQWNELSIEEQDTLFKFFMGNTVKRYDDSIDGIFSIGELIEFLGEDWWETLFTGCHSSDIAYKDYRGELCDVLWEETKYKLDKTTNQ